MAVINADFDFVNEEDHGRRKRSITISLDDTDGRGVAQLTDGFGAVVLLPSDPGHIDNIISVLRVHKVQSARLRRERAKAGR